jgi:hypothetical protein
LNRSCFNINQYLGNKSLFHEEPFNSSHKKYFEATG